MGDLDSFEPWNISGCERNLLTLLGPWNNRNPTRVSVARLHVNECGANLTSCAVQACNGC